jgi:hypothetical protein
MSFDRKKAPVLLDEDPPTSASNAHTLYLEIDLEVPPGNGKTVEPMTAVFAPDSSQLPATEVDVILWLHGDKLVWSKKKGEVQTWTLAAQRSRITSRSTSASSASSLSQPPKKKQFLLVVPTLADQSSAEVDTKKVTIPAGGLLGDKDQAEAYIDVVLKGVNAYMGKKLKPPKEISLKRPRNIVIAAHSGGGHILGNMAAFDGVFAKQVEELWCFDCTYWGNIINWAKKGHATRKLFVYSTGEKYGTRPNPKFDPTLPEGPKNVKFKRSGTGDTAQNILQLAKAQSAPATTIEVLIEAYAGNLVKDQSTPNFTADYGIPDGKKHYESIEKFLGKLVEKSDNLK